LGRIKRPIQRDVKGAEIVLPWILAIVRAHATSLNCRGQHLDLLSQMSCAVQGLCGLRPGEVYKHGLLSKNDRKMSLDKRMSSLKTCAILSLGAKVSLHQLLAGHLKKLKFVALLN